MSVCLFGIVRRKKITEDKWLELWEGECIMNCSFPYRIYNVFTLTTEKHELTSCECHSYPVVGKKNMD